MSVVIKQKNSDGTFTEVMKACQPNPRKIKVVTGEPWSDTTSTLTSVLQVTGQDVVKISRYSRDDLKVIPQGCSGYIESGTKEFLLTRIAYDTYLTCLRGADSAIFDAGATLYVKGIPSMQEVNVLGG